ncbi:MAG TPA: tetratricopeptide repeat protein [Flavobacterium sp.]|jgi:tetratricopeptide (TPR) repeat protein
MKYLYFLLLLPTLIFAQSDLEEAEKFLRQGAYAQAKPLLESHLKQNPGNLQATEYLGDAHAATGNWKAAFLYFEKLKVKYPNIANYQYKYGGAMGMIAKESNKFKALGMIDDIRSAFEKTIKLDAKHLGARWALIELYLQLPAIVGGSESKATTYANQLMALSPVDGYLSKGHISEHFNKFETAEKHYKKAIEAGGSKTTYQSLANLYKKMKQPQKSKAVLEQYKARS